MGYWAGCALGLETGLKPDVRKKGRASCVLQYYYITSTVPLHVVVRQYYCSTQAPGLAGLLGKLEPLRIPKLTKVFEMAL